MTIDEGIVTAKAHEIILDAVVSGRVGNFTSEQITKAILTALEAKGYVIVPVEPTHSMFRAGNRVVDDAAADDVTVLVDNVYRAMISAADGEG